jgi:hypothetical protein
VIEIEQNKKKIIPHFEYSTLKQRKGSKIIKRFAHSSGQPVCES